MSIDKYLSRVHNKASYNCAHFVCEVWEDMHGKDSLSALRGFLCAQENREVVLSELKKIELLEKPVNNCIVLFQRSNDAHVGILIDGKVLHLPEDSMARYEDVSYIRNVRGFTKVRYINV